MANPEHLAILRKGVDHWNTWYREFCDAQTGFRARLSAQKPDLSHWNGSFLREFNWQRFCYQRVGHHSDDELQEAHERYEKGELSQQEIEEGWVQLNGIMLQFADLRCMDLSRITLRGASLKHAELNCSDLRSTVLDDALLDKAKLTFATLVDASLVNCSLVSADLSHCDLTGANLWGANLTHTDLRHAILKNANLRGAILVETNLEGADLTGSNVYGVSVWNSHLEGAVQQDLRITPLEEAQITVDNLEVAQFVHLLLRRERLRSVVDTITSKTVLILGRFTPERKVILDALANEVRLNNLVPIIFDFERSINRDFTETIKLLAALSLFVIADITNPKSSPLELQATVPDFQIPFAVIIQKGEDPFAMAADLNKYDWVLRPTLTYETVDSVRKAFKRAILDPAWEKHKELRGRKTITMATKSIEDFLK